MAEDKFYKLVNYKNPILTKPLLMTTKEGVKPVSEVYPKATTPATSKPTTKKSSSSSSSTPTNYVTTTEGTKPESFVYPQTYKTTTPRVVPKNLKPLIATTDYAFAPTNIRIGRQEQRKPQPDQYNDYITAMRKRGGILRTNPLDYPFIAGDYAYRALPESKFKSLIGTRQSYFDTKSLRAGIAFGAFAPGLMTGIDTISLTRNLNPDRAISIFRTKITPTKKGYIARTGARSTLGSDVTNTFSSTYYRKSGKAYAGFGNAFTFNKQPIVDEFNFVTAGKTLAKQGRITKGLSSISYSQTGQIKEIARFGADEITTRVSGAITKPKSSSVLYYAIRPKGNNVKSITNVYGTNVFKNLKPETINIRGQVITKGINFRGSSSSGGYKVINIKPINRIISQEIAKTQITNIAPKTSSSLFKSGVASLSLIPTVSSSTPTTQIPIPPRFVGQDIISAKPKQREMVTLKFDYGLKQPGGLKTGGGSGSRAATALLYPPKNKDIIDTVPRFDTPQTTITRTRQTFRPPTTTRTPIFSPPPFNPTGTGTPFAPPIFALGSFSGLGLGSRSLLGGRKVTGYVPSFSALIFKIRGKKRKDITGIGFRPIPSGFSFTRRKKFDNLF